MTSIVRLCPICDGHPDRGDGTMACWYCRVRPGHPYRVAGYVLSARPLSDFAPGEIAVDVYHCDRWLSLPTPKRRGVTARARRLSDGFEVDEYTPQPRYVRPEEFTDPETWRLPTPELTCRPSTARAGQGVLL